MTDTQAANDTTSRARGYRARAAPVAAPAGAPRSAMRSGWPAAAWRRRGSCYGTRNCGGAGWASCRRPTRWSRRRGADAVARTPRGVWAVRTRRATAHAGVGERQAALGFALQQGGRLAGVPEDGLGSWGQSCGCMEGTFLGVIQSCACACVCAWPPACECAGIHMLAYA
eukprot:352386-Chlamydomonas_euryale.AAC.6